jgi:hypothetical protein
MRRGGSLDLKAALEREFVNAQSARFYRPFGALLQRRRLGKWSVINNRQVIDRAPARQ